MKDYLWSITIEAHTLLREREICPQGPWEKKEIPSKLFWRYMALSVLETASSCYTVEEICELIFPRCMIFREGCFKLEGWRDNEVKDDHRLQWRAMVAAVCHCAAKKNDEELAALRVSEPNKLRAVAVTHMLDA
jgi:hypothetical protein